MYPKVSLRPESITLTVDEYEAVRLIDLMKCTHEQCAAQMDISRTTATEIYESARTKIAASLIGGKDARDRRRTLPPVRRHRTRSAAIAAAETRRSPRSRLQKKENIS